MPKTKVAKTFYKFIMQHLLLQFFMEYVKKVGRNDRLNFLTLKFEHENVQSLAARWKSILMQLGGQHWLHMEMCV
jgi:hypothetical protein